MTVNVSCPCGCVFKLWYSQSERSYGGTKGTYYTTSYEKICNCHDKEARAELIEDINNQCSKNFDNINKPESVEKKKKWLR